MAQKNQFTTLVSVRLDNDILENINKAGNYLYYSTRSMVINNILSCVLSCTDPKTLADIILYNKFGKVKGKITLEYENDI